VQIFTVLENSFFFPASILRMHPVRRVVFGKSLWIQSVLDSSRVRLYNQVIGNVPLNEPVIEAREKLQRIKLKKVCSFLRGYVPFLGKYQQNENRLPGLAVATISRPCNNRIHTDPKHNAVLGNELIKPPSSPYLSWSVDSAWGR